MSTADVHQEHWARLGIGPLRRLSASEHERGFVELHCDTHGGLVVASAKAVVSCRCGRVARILRGGRVVNRTTLRPTGASARELNAAGHSFAHRCGDCGADLGGKTILSRHRVGRGSRKRCLSPDEMLAKGWRLTKRGRWSLPAPERVETAIPLTAQEAETGALAAVQGSALVVGP